MACNFFYTFHNPYIQYFHSNKREALDLYRHGPDNNDNKHRIHPKALHTGRNRDVGMGILEVSRNGIEVHAYKVQFD